MTVQELLKEPGSWTTGVTARDVNNYPVHPASDKAVRWCLIGAAVRCYGDRGARTTDLHNVFGRMDNILSEDSEYHSIDWSLSRWNDWPGRTHAEVLELVRRAGV